MRDLTDLELDQVSGGDDYGEDIIVNGGYVSGSGSFGAPSPYSGSPFYGTHVPGDGSGAWNPSAHPNINYNFLEQKEGGVKVKGYVPMKGHSGVTIGAGVDLGQHTASELRSWGVSENLIAKFTPYFGLQLQQAQNYLDSHPLVISQAEANTISQLAENAFTTTMANSYNQATGKNFFSLSQGAQTAVVDVAYQYGTSLKDATPNFWHQVTSGDWNGAVANLNNFGDDSAGRRQDEASLISADLSSGALHQGQ